MCQCICMMISITMFSIFPYIQGLTETAAWNIPEAGIRMSAGLQNVGSGRLSRKEMAACSRDCVE